MPPHRPERRVVTSIDASYRPPPHDLSELSLAALVLVSDARPARPVAAIRISPQKHGLDAGFGIGRRLTAHHGGGQAEHARAASEARPTVEIKSRRSNEQQQPQRESSCPCSCWLAIAILLVEAGSFLIGRVERHSRAGNGILANPAAACKHFPRRFPGECKVATSHEIEGTVILSAAKNLVARRSASPPGDSSLPLRMTWRRTLPSSCRDFRPR